MVRTIIARFESTCPSCNRRILAGTDVNWEKGSKATHVVCPQASIEDQADELLAEYERLQAAQPTATETDRLAALAAIKKGIYRVSLNGQETRYGVTHVNVNLIPNEKYGSVKVSEWNGVGVGYIDRDGRLVYWRGNDYQAATDPNNPRVQAVLAALDVILGSADPTEYAKAYAVESSTCWRCGADLVDEISRAVLMGPDCYKTTYGVTARQALKAQQATAA